MLGNEYFILTLPTTPLEVMPMVNMPSQHGYFAVLAVEPGDTQVTIQVSCKTDPVIAGGEMLKPGNTYTFTLEQFEVIQIEATGKELAVNDLSGSHIIADRKVAVFAGHEEAVVQLPDVEESCCCAEHIEEQLFPLDTWDTRYYAAKAKPRGPSDKDLWRVQAGAVNVKLTTNPPIDGIHGKTLAKKGDWVEAYTAQSFIVEGTGPIQVGQYLASQTCTDEFIGDPALIMAVSAGQYRTHYVFAAPKDYDEDYIGIVRQTGSTITLDGSPVNVPFTPFADGAYEVGYVEVQDGPHIIDGDFPFGLVQYGWDGPASYGNPGGLNLIKKQQD
jgi:hypothetical protein